jgi:hypothetical protein
LRVVVLAAWRHLHKIRRDLASLQELPIAALQAMTANINRDPKKTKPFTALDFAMYRERETDDKVLPAQVAATVLALRAEKKDSPILLAVWDKVLASADGSTTPPAVRALHSDDRMAWIVCPSWEGKNIRAGLIAVGDALSGSITLRDVDRPLATYTVTLPNRNTFAWLETNLLLVAGAPEN